MQEESIAHQEQQQESRQISLNRELDPLVKRKPRFVGNSITTSKYNIVTFLPIFLFEMFSRVAYLYFLAQVDMSARLRMDWRLCDIGSAVLVG